MDARQASAAVFSLALGLGAPVAQAAAAQPAPPQRATLPESLMTLPDITRQFHTQASSLVGAKIYVGAMEPAIRYYSTVFKMHPVGRIGGEVLMAFDGARPNAVQPAGTIPEPILFLVMGVPATPGAPRNAVVAIRVPDLEATKKAAAELGLPLAGQGATAFGQDPSGNWVEAAAISTYFGDEK